MEVKPDLSLGMSEESSPSKQINGIKKKVNKADKKTKKEFQIVISVLGNLEKLKIVA